MKHYFSRLTLAQRLTLIFTLLLLLFGGVLVAAQTYTSDRYSQLVIQQLSANVAQGIASRYLLKGNAELNEAGTKHLFGNLMEVNPSVEVYLLDNKGNIIDDAAPPGHVRRRQVDLTPVQDFLSGKDYPLMGDDPRSDNGRKVFSVAPLMRNQQTEGYLYVILLGEEFNQLNRHAQFMSLLKMASWSVLVALMLLLLLAVLAFGWITRPLRHLSRQVRSLESGGLSEMQALAQIELPGKNSKDEISLLQRGVISMASRIAEQWNNLSRQEQLRREFIANISHDLRTPLTSLHGYLESLQVMSGSLSEEEKQRYLSVALAQSRKVSALAQSLFELARLEYGVVRPQKERFSLAELLQDVFAKMELAAQTRRHQLVADLSPALPLVNADLGMIERVLTNLLDNAIRHTPEQGIIRVRVWLENSQLQVNISDSGPGIPHEIKQELFVRPSLLHRSELAAGGLGLMIVRQILQLHGSDIRLTDNPQGGASFVFALPL